ncbi:MAG: hypothetical protein RXQ97_01655 [Caldivirga sp.]
MRNLDLNELLYPIRAAITLTIPDLLAIIAASVVLSMLTSIYAGVSSVDFTAMIAYAAILISTDLWPSLIISLTYVPVVILLYRGFRDLNAAIGLRWGRVGSFIIIAAYILWVLNSIIVTVTQPSFKPIDTLARLSSMIASSVKPGSVLVVTPIYVSIIMAIAMLLGVVGILMCLYSLIKVGDLTGKRSTIKKAAVIVTISIALGVIPILGVVLLLIGLYLVLNGLKVTSQGS